MKRVLAGFLGLVLVMASSLAVGQETEESRLEPTIEALQQHIFQLELRVGEIEATLAGHTNPTPVPTVAPSSGGGISILGKDRGSDRLLSRGSVLGWWAVGGSAGHAC